MLWRPRRLESDSARGTKRPPGAAFCISGEKMPGTEAADHTDMSVSTLNKAKREARHSTVHPEVIGKTSLFRETTGRMV